MATVNKDFRVKQGLVVESGEVRLNGATSGQTLIKPSSTASGTITFPAVTGTVVTTGDTGTVTNTMLAGSIANDKLSNSSITINSFPISLGGSATFGTDNIAEGTTNKYFTDERAQDAIATAISNGTQTNISVTYDDLNNALNFNATGGVASLTGTANEVEVTNVGTAFTVGLPNDITIAGNVTINGTPTSGSHAVTKSYVDNVTAGLNFHAPVKMSTTGALGTTGNLVGGTITTTYNNGTSGLNATLTIATDSNWTAITVDGQSLAVNDRILIKDQVAGLQNGIYTVTSVGEIGNTTSFVFTRAADTDNNPTGELATGDFTFVQNGSANGGYGYILNTAGPIVVGTTSITYVPFNTGQTVVAGNGLIEPTPGVFAIDTAVTADLNSIQAFTNKTLTSPTITNPTISGLYLSDNNIVIEGSPDTFETTLTFTNPTSDRTITFKDESGTVAYTADVESAVDAFGNAVVAGTGISASYNSTSNALTITNTDLGSSQNIFKNIVVGATTVVADSNNDTLTFVGSNGVGAIANATNDVIEFYNTGVTSITGTANQISATGSTGDITLSLPQSIHSGATPTFAGLNVGSIALTDALIGTAVSNLTDGNATVVDSWSTASYSSAKYIVQMKKGTDIEVIEVLVTFDGNNNVYLTEYADVISNTQLGTTDADFSSGNVRLLVTASDGTTVKVHKTLIEA